jgi:hypothetical protein
MTLQEMELALTRIDLMIDFLQKKMKDGANGKIAEDIARYQGWRDDLDIQIGLERIRRGNYRRRRRRATQGGQRTRIEQIHRATASLFSASPYP